MNLLALDLGTATGVAFGPSAQQPRTWSLNFENTGAGQSSVFSQAMFAAHRIFTKNKVDRLAFEEIIAAGPVGGASRSQVLMGLRGIFMGMAHRHGVPVSEYHVATVRKRFIGNGGLSGKVAKKCVVDRCWQLGWDVDNDDEGDAAAIWEFARWKHTGKQTPPPGGLF